MTTTDARPGPGPAAGAPTDPLAPLRRAVLEAADADAAAALEAAHRHAEQTVAAAAAEAETVRSEARDEGRRDAEQVRVEQRARARRRARSIVLRAQRQALDDLTHAVHDDVRRLWRDEATARQIRAHLTEQARAEQGSEARIVDHPDGGIVATLDDRRATYLLTDLADRVIASLGDDLADLWTA